MEFKRLGVITHSYCATCLDAAHDALIWAGAEGSDDLDTQAIVLAAHGKDIPKHGCDVLEENEIRCDCEAHWVRSYKKEEPDE